MKLQDIRGIGPRLLARIRERWPKLLDDPSLRAHPYRLTEVPGIGFRLADRVAQAIEIAPDAPERINAGAWHVMNEVEQNGHTYCTHDYFGPQLTQLLGFQITDINLDEHMFLVGEQTIARRSMDFAEHVVAAKFTALTDSPAASGYWQLSNDLYPDQQLALQKLA